MGRLWKHIGTLVFESGLIGGGFAAEKMLSEIPGWGWLTYAIIASVVSVPLIYGPELRRWWARRRSTALAPAAIVEAAPPPPGADDLWRVNPGAGRTAARAIMEADSLDEARAIFDAHYATSNPKDTPWAAYAFMKRLEAVEEWDDVIYLTQKLIDDGIDVTDWLGALEHDPLFRGEGSRP